MPKLDKQKILTNAKNLIKQNSHCVFVQDVVAELGISSSTFYRLFPSESDEYKQIDDLLFVNKTNMKQVIRNRLLECKNVVGYLSLYRLLATREERLALMTNYNDEQPKQENNKIEIELK